MLVADYSHLDGRPAHYNDWMRTLINIAFMPLGATAKSVLMVIFVASNGPRGDRILQDSSPSITVIMGATGLSRSTVRRQLAALRDEGWIRVTHQGGHDGSRTVYAVANLMDSPDVPPAPLLVVK